MTPAQIQEAWAPYTTKSRTPIRCTTTAGLHRPCSRVSQGRIPSSSISRTSIPTQSSRTSAGRSRSGSRSGSVRGRSRTTTAEAVPGPGHEPHGNAPWDDFQYQLRNPFGYTAINHETPQTEFEDTTARVSLQYQWTDDLMTYITRVERLSPGSISQVPTNILVLDANGVATGRPAAGYPQHESVARRSAVPLDSRQGDRRQLRDRHEGRLGGRPAPHEPHGVHDRLAEHGRARPTSRRSGGTSTATISPRCGSSGLSERRPRTLRRAL